MSSLKPIGTPFIELPAVDSTNNYAMGLVREAMAQHGMAVFAHEQTRGKGQRNREWLSAGGENIAISIVVEPRHTTDLFLLSMMSATACKHFFNRYIADEITIKWPNDLYWRDRKAAGILIENTWQQGRWSFAVIGTGINVNQVDFGELGQKAVSLRQITGKSFDPLQLAKELCEDFEKAFRLMIKDPGAIRKFYPENLYRKGERIRLKKDNRIFEGDLLDVTDQGELLVYHATEESFPVGTVEWIINGG